ncbi:MAG: hypothetical protein JWL70_1666 [Acidimicrobiia bacterium]|nr:hypothetical protein [Acidimicrobiia bacterium]
MTMDNEELELIRASMRNLLDTSKPADLPNELIDAGWVDILEAEPAVAVDILAEEQGRSLAIGPVLDLALLHGAGLPIDATTAWVLPPMRRSFVFPAISAGAQMHFDGLVLAGHERATRFVAATDQGIMSVDASALTLTPIAGFDPNLGLQRATGVVDVSSLTEVEAVWTGALSAGRRALSSELIGLADQMLGDTIAYVMQREQFGRAIGSFQTVKHRMADVHVAISAARAAVIAAWEDNTVVSAMGAKCLAGRAHRLASTHCHQVHGGIAFTVEHGFHRFIQRGYLLDGLLGTADDLVREVGQHIVEAELVPRTPGLIRPGA